MNEFKRLFQRLRALLQRRGCSREDAEDLIQDAFERLQSYCEGTQVHNNEAFLVRTVQHGATDAHRRDLRRQHAHELIKYTELWQTALLPDEQAEIQEQMQDVTAMLRSWAPRTRDIYLLHQWGYDYAEISAFMGISASAVEKQVAKAAYLVSKWKAGT